MSTTIKSHIEQNLIKQFNPEYLQVSDESWQHGGGPEAQSHFKVIIVAQQFQGLKLLARHRLVQAVLSDTIASIRALSLHTLTREEWQKAEENNSQFRSPGCHNKRN